MAAAAAVSYAALPVGAEASTGADLSEQAVAAVPEFEEPSVGGDGLPKYMTTGPSAATELDPATSRLLGTTDEAKIWAVAEDTGDVCLVVVLKDTPGTASMTCSSTGDLLAMGMSLQASNTEDAVRTYLVPDGYEMDAPGLEPVGDRILVGDSTTPAPEVTLDSERRSGPDLEMPALPSLPLTE